MNNLSRDDEFQDYKRKYCSDFVQLPLSEMFHILQALQHQPLAVFLPFSQSCMFFSTLT